MEKAHETVKRIRNLLLPVPEPVNWTPDEYDVGLKDIMVNWKEADRADIGLIGVPFDTAVMGRRGCRFGPESIRSSLVFQTFMSLVSMSTCLRISRSPILAISTSFRLKCWGRMSGSKRS